jgi:hypothetical protein
MGDGALDFWADAIPGLSAEIMVSSEHMATLESVLNKAGISFEVKIGNVQK